MARRVVPSIMKATSLAIVPASLAVVYSQLPAAAVSDGPRVRTILEDNGRPRRPRRPPGLRRREADGGPAGLRPLPCSRTRHGRQNVAVARKHIQSLELYGPVSVQQWSGQRLPYVDNLVNLIVAVVSCQLLRRRTLAQSSARAAWRSSPDRTTERQTRQAVAEGNRRVDALSARPR